MTIARELEDTKVPISTVAGSAGGDRLDHLGQGIAASGMPEANGAGIEVDLVGDVVPDIGLPLNIPLSLAIDHPAQVGVGLILATAEPASLELGEVALEEGNLMLLGGGGGVDVGALDAEVVVDTALVDGSLCLGNQLGTAHVLAIPEGRLVQGDFDTLLGG